MNWCPRSCPGWRRRRSRRQAWAEVSSHKPYGVLGIIMGMVTSPALHPCLRSAPFQWDSLLLYPLLWPCSPGVLRAMVLLPVVGSSMVPPQLIPDVPPSLLPLLGVAACPGLNESSVRVGAVRDLYAWVLRVPEADLAMTFQEVSAHPATLSHTPWQPGSATPQPTTVPLCPWLPWTHGAVVSPQILVDLGSKNTKGLYRAQVRATVGGRPTAFTGLVGLESDSLARSMPGLVALALEALKT